MEQGIYRFSTGTHIDLDRILEIDPLVVAPYGSHFDVRLEFDILYMLQDNRRRFCFGLMNQLGMERFNAISSSQNSDDYKARLKAAIDEVQGKLQKEHDDLIEAWKARKAQMSSFEKGASA